jgi:hypothetical protein
MCASVDGANIDRKAAIAEEDRSTMRWTNDELLEALGRYEQECISAGMRPKAVHSYWDYARRFLKWRLGEYTPRQAPTAQRNPVTVSVTTEELADEAKMYARELEDARLKTSAIDTYYRHAMFFVRWLGDDFVPGGRLTGQKSRRRL